MRGPGLLTVARDVASWVGGWLIIFRQAGIIFDPPAQANETLIWVGAVLVGVPGALQILVGRFGGDTSTDALPPQQASRPLPPSSPGAP